MIDDTDPLSLDLGAQDPVAQDPKPQPAPPAPTMQQPVQPQQDPARREQDLLARFGMALQADPNLAAEARAYGMTFGTSVEWTVSNIKAAREMMKRREMEDLVRSGRLTAGAEAVMQNEWDANVAFDQIQNLGTLDRLVGALESGVLQTRIGLLADRQRQGIPLTPEEASQLEQYQAKLEKLPQQEDVTPTGIASGFLRMVGQYGVMVPQALDDAVAGAGAGAMSGSLVPGLGTSAGAFSGFSLGLTTGMLDTMRRVEGGSAYAEYRKMGYSHEAASGVAGAVGWVNTGIEVLGTAAQFGRPLLAPLKRRITGEVADMLVKPTLTKAVGNAIVNAGLGVAGQGAEEALQELSVLIGQSFARDRMLAEGKPAPDTEFMKGTATKRVLEAAVQGAIASVIPSALGSGYRLHWDVKQAKSAANQKDFISSISANASQQELLKRAPDLLTKALAATMRGTSAETMYFDSRLLLQAVEKLDQQQNEKTAVDGTPRMSAADQLERAFPGLLERARAAVGDVTIPTAEWVKLSGTDLGNELMQYATLDPDTPSPHEAGIAKGQAGSEALKQRSDQLLQQAEKMASEDEALAKDIAKAKLDVTKQLVEAGAYSARESKLFAELLVANATVYGKKLGLTPTQFFEKYPLPKTVVAPESPAQAGAGEVEAQQAPPPDAGVFDAANPPAPLDGAARGPVVMAVMTYDGKVYYDRNATMHGELADKFPEIADSIIDGGFIRDGKYVMGMSDGGYSAFEGDEDMVARARMFTEQVNSQGGELRSQDATQKPKEPTPAEMRRLLRSLTPAEQQKLARGNAAKIISLISTMPPAEEFAAIAEAGKAKKGWYKKSAEALVAVFREDAPRFAVLLAALSPQTSVEANLTNALNTWRNWVLAGRPTGREQIIDVMAASVMGNKGRESVLGAWINNAVRALSADDVSKVVLSGPKVNSFYLNLIGVTAEVTNDAWMANFALVDQAIFGGSLNKAETEPGKGPGYLAMNVLVREAASILTKKSGETWTPAEVQETVWSWAKTLYELQTAEVGATEALERGMLTDELIASTPDFGSLFLDPQYAAILQETHGKELADLRSRGASRPDDAKPVEGSATSSQAAAFAPEARRRFERRAAKRLEQLRDQRAREKQLAAQQAAGEVGGELRSRDSSPVDPGSDTTPAPRVAPAKPDSLDSVKGVSAIDQFPVSTKMIRTGKRQMGAARINSPQDLANAMAPSIGKKAVEHLDIVVTDKRGKPLAVVASFKGGVNHAPVDAATIVHEVSRVRGAAYFWMVHNHPSGQRRLSEPDMAVGQRFAELFRGSGIESAGIMAISSSGEWEHAVSFGYPRDVESGMVADVARGRSIPVMEREIARNDVKPIVKTGRPQAHDIQAAGRELFGDDRPGLIFFNTHVQVAGFVELDSQVGRLRGTPTMGMLYRAGSVANAHYVTIHNVDKFAQGNFAAANLASFFEAHGVELLDAYDSGKLEPFAETAADRVRPLISKYKEFYSRDSTPRPLFSALERAIASTPPGAMSARQWSAQLDRLVRTGAVKEQERFWSGIDEWLNLSTDEPGFVEFDDEGNQVRKMSRAQYLERLRTDPELESRVEPEPDSGTRQISRGDVVEFLRANKVEVMSGEESQQEPDSGADDQGGGDGMWVVSTQDDGVIGEFDTFEEAEEAAEEWKQGYVDGVLDSGIEVLEWSSSLIPESMKPAAREGDVAISVNIPFAAARAKVLARHKFYRDDLRGDNVNSFGDHVFLFRDEEAATNFRIHLLESDEIKSELMQDAAQEVAISDPSEARSNEPSPSEPPSFAEYSAGANLPGGVRGQEDYRNVGIVLGGRKLFEAPWTHSFKEAEGGVSLDRNRLAHYRASTRKVDGEGVMFVEEVQTDWGQQGRDIGFYPRNADSVSIGKADRERRDRKQRVLAEMEAIRQKAKDKGVPEWTKAFMSDADERQDWSSVGMAAEAARLREMAAQEAQLRTSPEAQPNEGPFVTKTDDWATLALKHIVMDAAKRGQRKIVFVNGEQAAAMFSLSSVFNRVSWQDGDNLGIYKQITFHRDSLGTGVRLTVTKDGTVISANADQVIGEKLSAVAGSEIAEKILSQWDTPRADNPRIFSGEMAIDATLGGEGMHTFYGNQDGQQSTPAGALQTNKNGEPMPAILPKVLRELAAKIGAKVVEGVQVDDLYGKNIALELTDETMRVLTEEGMPLFARTPDRRTLGSFSPSANRITLYKGYNRGTWLHEWGHYWLESTSAIVAGGNAPAELVADLGSLLDWFGIQPTATQSRLEVWAGMDLEARRKYHEKFAYHFEIYLAKGEAPSPELEGTFARIGAWIRDVYRSLQEMVRRLGDLYREEFGEDLGVLSPEAQRVMDRIFAVDEDIERAAVERELRPMFQTREEALAGGMSEAAWDEYQADLFLAKERAKDELIAASDERARSTMNRARRESLDMKAEEAEAREEMQPQVEAEVQGERVVRARRWLRKGEVVNADGSVTKMPTVQKLHRGAVKALLGIGTDKPKVSDEQFGKLRGMLADDGVDPNEVAPLLRYDTGEQLVRDLIDQPSEQEMVGVRVEARMRREYPEFFDANVRRNRIERAIANDLRMGTLANELLHLQRAILTSPAVGALAGPAKAAFDEANRLEVEQKSLREQANELDLLADAGILTDALALRAQANKLTDKINRLRRGSGGEQTRRTILSVVRNAAAANLRSRQIRDISPRALNAAAARMGRETMQALKEGNFVAAIDAKRRQMVLTEMARQAVDVADEVSSILRMARSFAKPDERLAKTHTMPLIYVGRVVLSAYGLRDPERDVPTGRDPELPTRIDEAMASVREMNEALANELAQDVVTPMIVAATGDYRDLTLEQFRVLRDNLEMLWYRSRNERFTLVEGQKQSLDETVELLLAAPGAVAPDRPAVGVQSGGTKWDEVVHDLLAGKAARKRVEHWCIQMDGGQPGWWHRAVFQRLADAETLAEQYERKWVTRAASILQRLVPLMRHEPITWQLEEGRTYTFGARGSVVGRTRNGPATAELFMAIMHAQGNRSNKEKLLLDPRRGWGSQDIDPMTGERSLNSAAWDTFFAEQVRAGVITKEMLDIAQEIGDLHEEMKPFLQQAHIEAFGFPFGTVEPSPFEVTFPDGTTASYRGWYLPAKADRLLVQDADLQAEDALVEARTSLAQTPRDMTKARDPNTFRSLSLQLSMLPGHIRESARFAAMGPAIVDVAKLLNKRKLKARLDAINPRLRANMLQPWVKNAALLTTSLRDESDTPLANKFMRRLDRSFTYLTMFGNVVNAVQNPVQLVPALTVLIADHGAGAVGAMQSAAASYGRNPMRMARVIRSMSSFMDGRGNEEVRQANKRIEKMLRDDVGKLGKLVDMRNDYEQYLLDSTYVLQSMTQHVGDQIAWKAAYSLEVKKHDDPAVAERRAVAYADSVVRRTQGSLRATDKSASEVTTPWKAFLNKFSGYFVQMANLSSSMIGAVRQQAGTRNRRIKYLGLYLGLWGIPFMLTALMAKAGMGSLTDDDDKDGEWWDDLAWDILLESQVRPLFPLFGAVGRGAEMVVNIVDNDQGTMARMPSPAPFAALERAAKGVARALDGKSATTMDGGDIATVLTLLVLPVPLPKQAGYLIDTASGDVEPTVRGAITGRAAKDEKR